MNWNDIFIYDPTTPSCLRWKIKPSPRTNIGAPAGYGKNRRGKTYFELEYEKKCYQCARIVWEMHNGPIPEKYKVDHIVNIEHNSFGDNRIENLQICTNRENVRKQVLSKNNDSGYKGVHFHVVNKKWIAQIRVESGPKYLGSFTDPVEAAKVYDEEAIKLYGEYALTNKSLGLI